MAKKPKVRTKVIDHGFKGIIKELRKLESKPHVKVGYPAESKIKDNPKESSDGSNSLLTVLDVAIFSEFGTDQLPERSYVRAAFDRNRKKYERMNKKLLVKIYAGQMSVEKALDILGLMIENDIKNYMREGRVKPKSQRAIDDGGKTLIDTSQLMNSIVFKRIMKK